VPAPVRWLVPRFGTYALAAILHPGPLILPGLVVLFVAERLVALVALPQAREPVLQM
jgi:hypothetical protein